MIALEITDTISTGVRERDMAQHLFPQSSGAFDLIIKTFDGPIDQTKSHIANVLSSAEQREIFFSALKPLVTNLDAIRNIEGIEHDDFDGAVLFFLFHMVSSHIVVEDQLKIMNNIAKYDEFTNYLIKFHQLPPSMKFKSFTFHACGTTSLILITAIEGIGPCALKIIQPQYIEIQAIRNATLNYMKIYGNIQSNSPKIYFSNETSILMEFVPGDNLYDYMQRTRQDNPFLSQSYVDTVADILNYLTMALHRLASQNPPINHSDLTPFNVIIKEKSDGTIDDVVLIDFGPNYVLIERLGRRQNLTEAFRKTELYTAPEITRGEYGHPIESDLYSIGMIGLDLLCPKPLERAMVGARLREIWQRPATVGVAQIIEDLIDNDPFKRALILNNRLNSPASADIFLELNKQFNDQARIYKEIVKKIRKEISVTSLASRGFFPDTWGRASDISKIFKLENKAHKNFTRSQVVTAILNAGLQSIIVFSFLVYTLIDAKTTFAPDIEIPFNQTLIQLIMKFPHRFNFGEFWVNLPGRMVAVTFGLIATRYYANIYSNLHIPDAESLTHKLANFSLRLNSFSYFAPIMLAIVYDPKWWPFCAFFGTFFTTMNNLICWQISKNASYLTQVEFSSEAHHEQETYRFLRIYREWWVLMGVYSVIILLIGILLEIGAAQDEGVYAAIICAINIFKIYRNNCASEAPFISGNVARMIFGLRRARKLSQVPASRTAP